MNTLTGRLNNDKTARTSSGESDTQYLIDEDEWIDYTIRFQNTGNDTAFSIVVTDTLHTDLDQSTFEQGPASHPFTPSFGMGRVVEWRFNDILLPDSGTNEAASHGQVSFRIRPVQPLLPGTMISNNADIFFDFNEPVRTNDAVLVAEFSTGLEQSREQERLMVFPNPAQNILHIAGLSSGATALRADIRGYDGRVCRSAFSGQHDIDISGLSAGAYTLILHLTNGERIVRPFIKY